MCMKLCRGTYRAIWGYRPKGFGLRVQGLRVQGLGFLYDTWYTILPYLECAGTEGHAGFRAWLHVLGFFRFPL